MQTVEGGHLNISQAFVDVRQLSTTCHQGQQVNQRLHRPLFHAFRPPHQNINLLAFWCHLLPKKETRDATGVRPHQ